DALQGLEQNVGGQGGADMGGAVDVIRLFAGADRGAAIEGGYRNQLNLVETAHGIDTALQLLQRRRQIAAQSQKNIDHGNGSAGVVGATVTTAIAVVAPTLARRLLAQVLAQLFALTVIRLLIARPPFTQAWRGFTGFFPQQQKIIGSAEAGVGKSLFAAAHRALCQ